VRLSVACARRALFVWRARAKEGRIARHVASLRDRAELAEKRRVLQSLALVVAQRRHGRKLALEREAGKALTAKAAVFHAWMAHSTHQRLLLENSLALLGEAHHALVQGRALDMWRSCARRRALARKYARVWMRVTQDSRRARDQQAILRMRLAQYWDQRRAASLGEVLRTMRLAARRSQLEKALSMRCARRVLLVWHTRARARSQKRIADDLRRARSTICTWRVFVARQRALAEMASEICKARATASLRTALRGWRWVVDSSTCLLHTFRAQRTSLLAASALVLWRGALARARLAQGYAEKRAHTQLAVAWSVWRARHSAVVSSRRTSRLESLLRTYQRGRAVVVARQVFSRWHEAYVQHVVEREVRLFYEAGLAWRFFARWRMHAAARHRRRAVLRACLGGWRGVAVRIDSARRVALQKAMVLNQRLVVQSFYGWFSATKLHLIRLEQRRESIAQTQRTRSMQLAFNMWRDATRMRRLQGAHTHLL
jgi:hypothetical protein